MVYRHSTDKYLPPDAWWPGIIQVVSMSRVPCYNPIRCQLLRWQSWAESGKSHLPLPLTHIHVLYTWPAESAAHIEKMGELTLQCALSQKPEGDILTVSQNSSWGLLPQHCFHTFLVGQSLKSQQQFRAQSNGQTVHLSLVGEGFGPLTLGDRVCHSYSHRAEPYHASSSTV